MTEHIVSDMATPVFGSRLKIVVMVPEQQKACYVGGRSNPRVETWTGDATGRNSRSSYYRARYYDPSLGRFLAEDSTRFASGTYDFYPYVNNDPQNYSDAYGLQKDGGETCCQENIDLGRAELERALNNAQLMRGRIVKKYKDCLLKTLPILKIRCNPTSKGCGLHVPVAVDTVVITPLGSKGRKGPCGPVASTFLHEMIHLCYNLDLSAPKMSPNDQEKEAQQAECEVFGFNCRKR